MGSEAAWYAVQTITGSLPPRRDSKVTEFRQVVLQRDAIGVSMAMKDQWVKESPGNRIIEVLENIESKEGN